MNSRKEYILFVFSILLIACRTQIKVNEADKIFHAGPVNSGFGVIFFGLYKNNIYQFFPWTYPDYKSKDYQEFFLRMRQIYRSQLRNMCILNRED